MPCLNHPCDIILPPLYVRDLGFYYRGDGWENYIQFFLSAKHDEGVLHFPLILHVYLIAFTLRTMYDLSVGEEIYSLGIILLFLFW